MAYYWITEAQTYIHSLGFGERRRAIDNRPQHVRINQYGADNSFATDHPKNELRFGKGGVDDAEDGEVILHEYGLQGSFDFPGTTMVDLANSTVSAADQLHGAADALVVRQAFADRGILN
jgi:hypothetical protein